MDLHLKAYIVLSSSRVTRLTHLTAHLSVISVYRWAIYIRWTMTVLRHNWVVMNPTVMQPVATSLTIQNTLVTAES